MSKTPKVSTIPKKVVDWEALAPHYRAGIRSLKDLGKEFGCSDAAIVKHAAKQNPPWTRDLKAKIQARAEAKVSASVVSAEVSANRKVREEQVVEANAEMQMRIRLEHRTDIARTRGLFRTLIEEIEVASNAQGQSLIEALVELVNPPDQNADPILERAAAARREKQLQRLLDGAPRIDSAKKLTEMLEKLVRMEREAFGIDGKESGEGEYEATLRRVIEEANRG